MDLINIYSIFHPSTAKYTFFPDAHETFTETDHILYHKIHLTIIKYKSSKICFQTTMELNFKSVTAELENPQIV